LLRSVQLDGKLTETETEVGGDERSAASCEEVGGPIAVLAVVLDYLSQVGVDVFLLEQERWHHPRATKTLQLPQGKLLLVKLIKCQSWE
jgi:hypothetical protein